MPYLQYAVKSVLNSNCPDLELVVSLDDVDGGSSEFLDQISDPRLKVITPPAGLSMSEHWDFAQGHAKGEWQMFLGQDDMMMTGFSDAFEKLAKLANEAELGVVVARRAYVCWPPLKDPNLKALQYWKTDEVSVKNSVEFAAKALLTDISYHAGPQMYTTTLVSKAVIESIRSKHRGNLILGHPQDAFLAACLLNESPEFIFSGQPFSWVGTSTKSAGLAIARLAQGDEGGVATDYVESVARSSAISYTSSADFRHGVNSRYFYDALEGVWPELLKTVPFNKFWFRIRVDSLILYLAFSSRALALDQRSLVTSPTNFLTKKFFVLWLVLFNKSIHFFYWLGSKILSNFRNSALNFTSIDEFASEDDLYSAAMRIAALPSGNHG
jgi:hypothetical protein